MNYLDFTLKLNLSAGAKCRVTVLSARGEDEHEITLPLDPETLSAVRAGLHGEARRRVRAPRDAGVYRDTPAGRRDVAIEGAPSTSVVDFGKALYGAVFQGPVAELFAANREHASQSKRGLRVKLVTPDAVLALVPWELFCTRRGHYLSLSEHTPLVRHVLVGKPHESLRVTPPLRVLGVLSTGGGAPLDLERERAQIDAELAPLVRVELAEVEWLRSPTNRELLEALDRKEWHILHFAGHGSFDRGSAQGVLAMAPEGGRAHLRANDLRVLLRDRPSVRMVFLNSCDGAVGDAQELFSSTAAIVTEAGVPAVLAMQFPVSDDVATAFARRVYRQLVAGDSVEEAVTEARKEISLIVGNPLEWATPVLFMRSAEGAILQISRGPRESEHPRRVARPSGPPPPSRLIRIRYSFAMAAVASALTTTLGIYAAYNWQSIFGHPPPTGGPAIPSATAPPPSPPPSPDWSAPCAPAAVTARWIADVRSALCDLESNRPAVALPNLERLAQREELTGDVKALVIDRAGRARREVGHLLVRTKEGSAAVTLSLDDGQAVAPNIATPVNPGWHKLKISKGGGETESRDVRVSPGASVTVNLVLQQPHPEKPVRHDPICDNLGNCVGR